jgi:hypothetical protein
VREHREVEHRRSNATESVGRSYESTYVAQGQWDEAGRGHDGHACGHDRLGAEPVGGGAGDGLSGRDGDGFGEFDVRGYAAEFVVGDVLLDEGLAGDSRWAVGGSGDRGGQEDDRQRQPGAQHQCDPRSAPPISKIANASAIGATALPVEEIT